MNNTRWLESIKTPESCAKKLVNMEGRNQEERPKTKNRSMIQGLKT